MVKNILSSQILLVNTVGNLRKGSLYSWSWLWPAEASPVPDLMNHTIAKTVTLYDMIVSLAELPFAPTRPTTTQITADWITITWQPGGGPQVDSYTLYYRAKSSSQWIVMKDIRGRTSMSLKELQPFTTYQFRLFALNGMGTSKPSPLAEFTTSPKGLYFSSIFHALEQIRRFVFSTLIATCTCKWSWNTTIRSCSLTSLRQTSH